MTKASHEPDTATLEGEFAELRRAYERYWAGVERPEPEASRDALRLAFQKLHHAGERLTNTAHAFRLRSLCASFLAFDQLCTRRAQQELTRPVLRSARRQLADEQQAQAAERARAPFREVPRVPEDRARDDEVDALYAELSAALEARGRPAPPRARFAEQVKRHLAAAQAKSETPVHLTVRLSPDGRAQLVVARAAAEAQPGKLQDP